jgi:hypothetical protein
MSQECGIKISIETTRISYRKMGIMATYSEAGNFLRDILGTLSLCGDCAWPVAVHNEVNLPYRAWDELKRPPMGLLRICSSFYITLVTHQMRCWKNLCALGPGSELQQLELPPFA